MSVQRIHETTALAVNAPTGGRLLVRLIDVGEGTSGYYPPATLQRAAAERVFPAGTHCYLDHAAAIRRGPGGERSVRDLAGVLGTDARWDAGLQALVAEVKLLGSFAQRIKELAPHIGLSIAASGMLTPPTMLGGKPTVTALTAAESVDFVVKAGRGGSVLEVLEAEPGTTATPKRTHNAWGTPITEPETVNAFGRKRRTLWGQQESAAKRRTLWDK